MDPPLSIEQLERYHEVADFDCGVQVLNAYLIERAHTDQRVGQAHIFAALRGDIFVVGASIMEPASRRRYMCRGVEGEEPEAVIAIRSRSPSTWAKQGHHLGEWMLLEALSRAGQAADAIDVGVVLVHAEERGRRGCSTSTVMAPEVVDVALFTSMLLIQDIRSTFWGLIRRVARDQATLP